MALETKFSDGLLTTSNLTGGLSAINADDMTWLVATSTNSNSVIAVSFPTPTGNPDTGAGVQNFTVKYRVTANATSITFNAYLRENGTRINGGTAIDSWTSASIAEVTREITWDAALLGTADGSLVELEIEAIKSGGSPANRTTGEFQFVDWDVVFTIASNPYTADLSTSSVGVTPNSLDITALVDYDATLSSPSVSVTADDLDVAVATAFEAALSSPGVVVSPESLDVAALVDFDALLSSPSVSVTPDDFNVTALIDYDAALTAPGVAVTQHDLDVVVTTDFDAVLSLPSIAVVANDLDVAVGSTTRRYNLSLTGVV